MYPFCLKNYFNFFLNKTDTGTTKMSYLRQWANLMQWLIFHTVILKSGWPKVDAERVLQREIILFTIAEDAVGKLNMLLGTEALSHS